MLARSSRTNMPPMMYQMPRRDPAWQRDSILLLAYCGVEDLARNAATGVKVMPGFDLLELNSELAASFIVAGAWLLAAFLTGVLNDEHRYSTKRVFATWALAAPLAGAARVAIFSGFLVGTPNFVLTDVFATLALQIGLRLAEEQGYV